MQIMTLVRAILLAFGLAATSAVVPCHAAEIWLSATEPVWRVVRGWPYNDYWALFTDPARWQRAIADVKVFELSKRFVAESSDAQLILVVEFIRRHQMKLSMQATPLLASQRCGLGVEGHGPPNDLAQLAVKLRRLGADLSYLRMDEPLWYGREWNGSAGVIACHSSIKDLAREAAAKLMAVRKIYPYVKIGDIEPIGVPYANAAKWPSEIATWMEEYRIAMGEPLRFLHIDIGWEHISWQVELRKIDSILRSENVALGVIYDGTRADLSDAAWIDDAQAHFVAVEGMMHILPDYAIIQSWMDFPRAMLPENERDTLTNLVLRYMSWQLHRN